MGLSGGDKLVKGLTNHHSLLSYHIEYNEKEGLWKKTDVKQSPKLLVRLQVAARDYEEFGAEILWEVDKPLRGNRRHRGADRCHKLGYIEGYEYK